MNENIKNNIGQDPDNWSNYWGEINIKKEIQKWDFFGTRPWILKYVPRNGKVIEAGCGTGRWVLYLLKMGINITGIDFSEKVIKKIKKNKDYSPYFDTGDVKNLPYKSNTLSGYISLGVIEHFIEGPDRALSEAYRVLRPGGIAIITTPSKSWYIYYKMFKKMIKNFIKVLIRKEIKKKPFFQYEYRPSVLKKHVLNSNLRIVKSSGFDLLYTFSELSDFNGDKIRRGTFFYWFAHKFEKTFLGNLGAQSIVIAIKISEVMHCFFCDKLSANKFSLNKYDVPLCQNCQENKKELTKFYLKNVFPYYHSKYKINPPLKIPIKEKCNYCNTEFLSDEIFENYGFIKKICNTCIREKTLNIKLSNKYIQPIWRN